MGQKKQWLLPQLLGGAAELQCRIARLLLLIINSLSMTNRFPPVCILARLLSYNQSKFSNYTITIL